MNEEQKMLADKMYCAIQLALIHESIKNFDDAIELANAALDYKYSNN